MTPDRCIAPGCHKWDGTDSCTCQCAALPEKVVSILTNVTQILDVVKVEWAATNSWSEWDQSVRDSITELLRDHYTASGSATASAAITRPIL